MPGEVGARSLEHGGEYERWGRVGGGVRDLAKLSKEGFRVWTVFSKPQRHKAGLEPHQGGCDVNGGWGG